MRVTLDTNVLVSAFISNGGLTAEILELIASFEEITPVLSDEILAEFSEVMGRAEIRARLGYNERRMSEFEQTIRSIAEIIEIKSAFKAVGEDPEDDSVVNTGYDGRVDYIVSGDKHLLRLERFKGVRIVSPRFFLSMVTKRFGDLVLSKSNLT